MQTTSSMGSSTHLQRKPGSFLGPCASVSHLPQVLQAVHCMDAQLFTYHQVADVDVEDDEDGDFSEVYRGNAVNDAPEPPDVVAQCFLGSLLKTVEVKDGRWVRRAAGLEMLACLALHFLAGAMLGLEL